MKYISPDLFIRPAYNGSFNFEQEVKPKSESYFNLINDKENLNRINKIANEGVNHIVAAFYIKSVQQSKVTKNNQSSNNNSIPRRSSTSVPVNSVNLEEDNANTNGSEQLNNSENYQNNEKEKMTFGGLNTSLFNDKFTPDINEFTENQLNTVNDVMKKLKENKINEFVDNEYININK